MNRDIMAEIQYWARRGSIRCKLVAPDVNEIKDFADFPAGWKGYMFDVPGRAYFHVRLHHSNEGWFRLVICNKWGDLQEGMLHNLIPTGNPEVSFKNPKDEVQRIYVVVDDPGWMSHKDNPFTLSITRKDSW